MLTLLDAALDYAARGWHVFPCEPRGKRPLGRLAPHGLKDATLDEAAIRAWWSDTPDANVAIATGPVSRLFVVDLDGPAGSDAYGVLLVEHSALTKDPHLPDGATVRTPGGGWHLYAALPSDARVPNSAGRIAPSIDVRGEGGYVVAPPSVHPAGGRYVWMDEPATALPEPRGWILEAVGPKPRPITPPALPRRADASSAYGHAAARRELEELLGAVEGERNDRLNRAAFSLGQLVAGGELPLDGTRLALQEIAQAIGLGAHEAALTIESGLRSGSEWPRVAPERTAA